MPRAYGTTNAAPYATAPVIGAAGDTYWNTATKSLYVCDGTTWNQVTIPVPIAIGATAPANPVPGTLWWRSDPDAMLFIYYNDGTSSQWVPASHT
jgi:hypothetical protein